MRAKKKTSVGLLVQWAQQNVTGSFAHDCSFSVNTSALKFFSLASYVSHNETEKNSACWMQ